MSYFHLLVCCLLLHGGRLCAQIELDVVLVGPDVPQALEKDWKEHETQVYKGSIKQLDSEKLILIDDQQRTRTIPSRRVEEVTPVWAKPDVVEPARELLLTGKYGEAFRALDEAWKSGIPQWQQRLVIAELVQALVASGNIKFACIYFSRLVDTNPPSLIYADMPLCWTTRQVPADLRQQVEEWLSSDKEPELLMAASWLLSGRREEARAKLVQLQRSENKILAQLAIAQSWRLSTPPETMAQFPKWQEFREKLIPPLRIGPTEFMADRLMRIGEPELAVAQWMRVAAEHADKHFRAVKALENAKQLLQREGEGEEVRRLEKWIENLK